ncbi:MAG: hypothetical protein R2834_17555, partial [Rhodothermales bacterium]
MARMYRLTVSCFLLLAFIATPIRAQQADTTDYAAERHLIQSTLGTLVKVIKTATFRDEDNAAVGDRLQNLAERLNTISESIPADGALPQLTPASGQAPFASAATPQLLGVDDLQLLEEALNDLYAQVRELRATLEADEEYGLAEQMATIEDGLDRAVVQTRRLVRRQSATDLAQAESPESRDETPRSEWLRPGRYEEGERTGSVRDDEENDIDLDVHLAINDVRREVEDAR